MKKSLSGLLILSFCVIFFSCGKKNDPTPANNTTSNNGGAGNTITAPYYWQAKIDGVTKTFQHNVNGYGNGAPATNTDDSSIINEYGTDFGKYSFTSNGLTEANDNATVMFNLAVNDPEQSDYNSFFQTGSKNYVATQNSLNGVYIQWVDPNGNLWTTTDGSQTGSTFTITGISSATLDGEDFKVVEATFSCKLYNGSNSKTVTNGKVKGIIDLYMNE